MISQPHNHAVQWTDYMFTPFALRKSRAHTVGH